MTGTPISRFALRAGASCLAIAAGLAIWPVGAQASATQESIVQDDKQLLYSGPAAREEALDDFAALGADTIRVLMVWNRVAPSPSSITRPVGFNATDPAQYPGWAPYDELIASAQSHGLEVILNPTGPGPAWASECSGSAQSRMTCNPSPAEFRSFIKAAGTRYGSIHRWSIYNEPNVSSWLSPQYVRRGGVNVASSPTRYRLLFEAATTALTASGHGSDQILIGETAPFGSATGRLSDATMSTAGFIRDLLCVDAKGRAITTGGCRSYRRLRATGYAHHPYIRGGSRPPTTAARLDEITISSSSQLFNLLDLGGRLGRINKGLPVYYTEYGFQTNPPDHLLGVSPTKQAEYINESDAIAYRQSRVRSVAQYLLRDEPLTGGFQSGLRFFDGSFKPAYAAYRLAIWVANSRDGVTVYGQTRPAKKGVAATVAVQFHGFDSTAFKTIATVSTSTGNHSFTKSLAKRSGLWRLRWTHPSTGEVLLSRTATTTALR